MHMSRQRDLLHISIDTGDGAMIPATHLQPQTRTLLRGIIAGVSAGNTAVIPTPPEAIAGDGWRLIGGIEGGEHAGSAAIFTLGWMDGRHLRSTIWIAIARKSRSGKPLWSMLHRPPMPLPTVTRTDPDRQPMTPWLATRMLPGVAGLSRKQLEWTADFAESLAWTWLLDLEESDHATNEL